MLKCFNCKAEFGMPGGEATSDDKRALSEHLEACIPLQRWTSAREYVVSMLRNDSTGSIRDVVVYAYTAEDAITQMEIEQRGSQPGERVHRIHPR